MKKRRPGSYVLSTLLAMILITGLLVNPVFCSQNNYSEEADTPENAGLASPSGTTDPYGDGYGYDYQYGWEGMTKAPALETPAAAELPTETGEAGAAEGEFPFFDTGETSAPVTEPPTETGEAGAAEGEFPFFDTGETSAPATEPPTETGEAGAAEGEFPSFDTGETSAPATEPPTETDGTGAAEGEFPFFDTRETGAPAAESSSCAGDSLESVEEPAAGESPVGESVLTEKEYPASESEEFIINSGVLTKYNGSGGQVLIPTGVKSIGNSAFYQCESLKSVTIPEGVTGIGDNAFKGCSCLETVTFQGNVRTLGKDVFSGCSKLIIECFSNSAGIISYAKQYSLAYRILIRVPVKEIRIDKSSAFVFAGKTITLTASAIPNNADIKDISWKSSNTNAAKVNSYGVVTGIARGAATITASAKDGSGVKATCKVTVKQRVRKLTINRKSAVLKAGKSLTLKVTAAPSNANNKNVRWTTSNNKIATVTAAGTVRGVSRGTATITAVTKDGSGIKVTCKVTIRQPVRKLTMSRKAVTVKTGRKTVLKVTAAPKNANNKAVKWTTSNKKIATVTSAGVVRGVSRGTAIITAAAKDGSGVKATCKVTVIRQTYPEFDKINVKGTHLTKGQYANFRNVYAGSMSPNILYRCINPLIPYSYKQKMPAYYADRLLEAHDVNIVINLCDTSSEMKSKGYSKAVYYKKLLKEGKAYSRKLTDNGKYDSIDKKKQLAGVVRVLVRREGPYAIHCRWGQGRTGMVIMLLECLMGADYNYLYNDFVTTFRNFEMVGRHSDPGDYNKEFSKYMRSITGKKASNPRQPKERDWSSLNLSECARQYLRDGGMTDEEIRILRKHLSTP